MPDEPAIEASKDLAGALTPISSADIAAGWSVRKRGSLDRRTFLRGMGSLALLSGGAVVLGGCATAGGNGADTAVTPADQDEDTDDAELDELTFLSLVPPESLTFAPELLAISTGRFTEVNLEVRLEAMRGSAQAIQGILSELALLSRVGDIEIILGVAERGAEELVNLGTLFKDSTIRFVSAQENPIRSAADFADQLIGIPSEGGTSELTVDLVAQSAGIDPTDLSKQVVGLAPGTFDLVEDGRIACYAVSLDTAVLLEQERDAVVFSPGDAIFSGGQCYMANRNMLELEDDDTPRDIVQRYLDVIRQSVEEIIGDADNDFANVLEVLQANYDFGTVQNTEVAAESLRQYVASWTLDGEENTLLTTEDRWQGVYDELVQAGSVPDGLDPSEWHTNEFVS